MDAAVARTRTAVRRAPAKLASIACCATACFHPVYDQPACDHEHDDACPTGLICVGHAVCDRCDPGAASSPSCGASGRCEPEGACSQPDPTCDSGWRFDDQSGESSGTCAPSRCFGKAPFRICLAAAPTEAVPTMMAIDTDDRAMCATTVSGADGDCVLAGTTIAISALWTARGNRPLVLLASDSITIASGGTLDVGSHRIPESTGAGADPSDCAMGPPPVPSNTGGGGAGGSFLGAGGVGGSGGTGTGGAGGSPAATVGAVTTLRGGCAGQDGAGPGKGAGGHGGGAALLIAGNRIEVSGALLAGGAGGGGGAGSASGGGGGGAGGMIVLDAPTISAAGGLIVANGGAGAEGAGDPNPLVGGNGSGAPGGDALKAEAARRGTGNTTDAGDGGPGSTASGKSALTTPTARTVTRPAAAAVVAVAPGSSRLPPARWEAASRLLRFRSPSTPLRGTPSRAATWCGCG